MLPNYAFDGQLTSPTALELKTSDSGTIQTYVFHSTTKPATTILATAASSYNNAACISTSTPPPLPTPLPMPSTLPLTFTGSGYSVIGADNFFTTTVPWHFRATCITSNGGAPYTITMRVWRVLPTSTNGLSDDTAWVGKDINFSCNGQPSDSSLTNPGGFHAGTYSLEVVTGGNWKITVEKE